MPTRTLNALYEFTKLSYITNGTAVAIVLAYTDYERKIINKNNVINRVLTNVSAGIIWPVTLYLAQSTKSGGTNKISFCGVTFEFAPNK